MDRVFSTLVMALALSAGVSEAKTYKIKAGIKAIPALTVAFEQAKPKDRIRIGRGVYDLPQGLTLAASNVRVSGAGVAQTVLRFVNQTDGQPGIRLAGSQVRLRGFVVEDAVNGAILAEDGDGYAFTNIEARFTAPSLLVTADGVALTRARNILLDGVNVVGAVDAGIMLSQCENAVIRASKAQGNGVGLVLENTRQVDVYDNAFTNNGVGFAAIQMPQLPGDTGVVRVFRNQIESNDLRTRASSLLGTGVPPSVGLLVLAAHDMHIYQNSIGEHGGANMVLLSSGGAALEPDQIPVTHNVVARENVFGRSGYAAQGTFATLQQRGFTIGDIMWDGVESYGKGAALRTLPVRIEFTNNAKLGGGAITFTNLGIKNAGGSLEGAKPSQTLPPGGATPEPAPVILPDF
jgi:parallel beta-helix repeat protein